MGLKEKWKLDTRPIPNDKTLVFLIFLDTEGNCVYKDT